MAYDEDLYQIIIDCKNKNVLAQQRLYELYSKKMFLVCRRYMRNDLVAEEVVMNGFLQFFSSIDKFDYQSEAETENWLRRMMINICLRQLDKSTVMMISIEALEDTASDEDLLSQVSVKEIYRLITQMPTGYRTVFNLYYVENLSHEEISKALGIEKNTSKSQLSKARRFLQDLLIKTSKDYESRKRK